MKCVNCGYELAEGANFCNYCGSPAVSLAAAGAAGEAVDKSAYFEILPDTAGSSVMAAEVGAEEPQPAGEEVLEEPEEEEKEKESEMEEKDKTLGRESDGEEGKAGQPAPEGEQDAKTRVVESDLGEIHGVDASEVKEQEVLKIHLNPPTASDYANTGSLLEDLKYMLKYTIGQPMDVVKKMAGKDSLLSSLVFLALKDILIAIWTVILFGTTQSGHTGKGFLFLLLLPLVDVAFTGIYYGMGKLFGSEFTIKEWVAAYAASQVWPFYCAAFAIIFTVLGAQFLSYLFMAFSLIMAISIIYKGFDNLSRLDDTRLIYAQAVSLALTLVFAYLLAAPTFGLIGKAVWKSVAQMLK